MKITIEMTHEGFLEPDVFMAENTSIEKGSAEDVLVEMFSLFETVVRLAGYQQKSIDDTFCAFADAVGEKNNQPARE